jgi:arginine decarboxylase
MPATTSSKPVSKPRPKTRAILPVKAKSNGHAPAAEEKPAPVSAAPARKTDPAWTVEDAAELYGVRRWSAGYFDLNPAGEVVVKVPSNNGHAVSVSLKEIVDGALERGMALPAMLRFSDILEAQIDVLNRAFAKAIQLCEYKNHYRGVYPIKVNQQQRVVQEITGYGRKYHYGLECGSKAELIAALAHMHDPQAYIVCNGYKDAEFIDLALHSLKMGITTVLVLEMPSELDLVLERAERLGVRPVLGVRVKLSAKSSGHWVSSGGDSSVFGLNMAQVIDIVDKLRKEDRLDCLRLLHYHQGSQIPNIRTIRQAVTEAARVYVDLVKEGAAMGMLDLGGGLGIDYDGSKSSTTSSVNYSIEEYCVDVIEAIMNVTDEEGVEVAHPVILTESGRAVVAHSSVLIFNILDVNRFEPEGFSEELPEDAPELLENLMAVYHGLNENNLQESYNDAVYYRDEVRTHFALGNLSLRERARAEQIFWHVELRIAQAVEGRTDVPEELHHLEGALVDVYYGNFSVFQSLPDSWAINQLFPVMPIQKLDEKPTARGVIADITCDCDGRLDNFIGRRGPRTNLPIHAVKPEDNYMLGVFLVGAYQETLGDLHNLLGDTNVVSVELRSGQIKFAKELEGDTVADVLSYVEYDPKAVMDSFRKLAEQAVEENRISARERREIMRAFEQGLNGYTYFEPHGE